MLTRYRRGRRTEARTYGQANDANQLKNEKVEGIEERMIFLVKEEYKRDST